LQQEQVVDAFVVNIKTRSITVSLSNSYVKKTIVSGIYDDWGETVDKFADRAKKKEVSDKHIEMLTDTLDRTSHVPLIKMDGSE